MTLRQKRSMLLDSLRAINGVLADNIEGQTREHAQSMRHSIIKELGRVNATLDAFTPFGNFRGTD